MKTKLIPLLFVSFTANAADLATTFSSTYSKVTINNSITYTGSVVNKGSDAANNVQLFFYMPPKNVSIGNLPSGCSNANPKIICSVGNLNVGDSATRTVSVFYTKKGANLVSVNAVTDSTDTNYSNNSTRLTTNVTESTNTANSPLIPNVVSAKVNPTSILQGNTLTFTANLDAPLPNGYSVKVIYDGSYYAMNGSGTNYSLSNSLNTAGMRTFRTGVYDNYGSLKGSEMTGTFEVTKLNTPPTLSIIRGANTATVGTAYTLQLQAYDADGNLSNIQITNWGDNSSNYQNATNNNPLSFSHTFSSAGSYTISAIAYDTANATSTPISKSVSVSQPVVVTPPAPVLSTTGYTKIANNGSLLSDDAKLGTAPTDWACTKDNNTGLIWEVKTDDGGLRDFNKQYDWYQANDFVKVVNESNLCGSSNWRLPILQDLVDLIYCSDGKYSEDSKNTIATNLAESAVSVHFVCASNSAFKNVTTTPTINTNYFPHTTPYYFWSSQTEANNNYKWWTVYFGFGFYNTFDNGNNDFRVRLVR